MPSRASNAVLMVDSREARDIEISSGGLAAAGKGLCRDSGAEGTAPCVGVERRARAGKGVVWVDGGEGRKREIPGGGLAAGGRGFWGVGGGESKEHTLVRAGFAPATRFFPP